MKKHYFISLICIASLFTVYSYGQTKLSVVNHSGEREFYSLSEIQRITFPENNMLISLKDSSKTGFILNDVRMVSLGLIDVPQSVQPIGVTEMFLLYPVPARNTLNIKFKNAFEDEIQFSIFNMQGQTILHQNTNIGANESNIMLSIDHLSSGLYLFQLNIGTQKFTQKFLKK